MLSATFASVMETIGFIILGLLMLMFMVVVHELGHYTAGKLLGFKITEFGIGFGPAIFKKKNKKTGEVFFRLKVKTTRKINRKERLKNSLRGSG